MKRYGDLLNCKEIDSTLFDLIKTQIKQTSKENNNNKMTQLEACTFDEIWTTLCQSADFENTNMDGIFYNDRKSQIDFALGYKFLGIDYEHPHLNYYNPLTLYMKNDPKYFEKIFMCLANYLPLYYDDTRMSLIYNFSCDARKKKKDRPKYNSTFEQIEESEFEYNLPFIYTENNYVDFCSFTWKSLYHNSECLECFKQPERQREKYINSKTLFKITETFSRYPSILITDNDRWIIEKIFGMNTILTLMQIVNTYNNSYTHKNIYIPILKELLKCKPIHIRVHLTKLVCSLLLSIQELTNEYDETHFPTKPSSIFNETAVASLKKELAESISKINIIYSTFLKCFYKYKIIPVNYRDWFYSAETNTIQYVYKMKKRLKCKKIPPLLKQSRIHILTDAKLCQNFSMYGGIRISKLVDFTARKYNKLLPKIEWRYLLNIYNPNKIFYDLLPKHRIKFFNTTDLEYKYGTLQEEAINSVYYSYN